MRTPGMSILTRRKTISEVRGIGIIHRLYFNNYTLRKLMDQSGYIKSVIERIIENNTTITQSAQTTVELPPLLRGLTNRRNNLEVIRMWGRAPKKLIEDWQSKTSEPISEFESDGKEVEVCLELCGNEVIKVVPTSGGAGPTTARSGSSGSIPTLAAGWQPTFWMCRK